MRDKPDVSGCVLDVRLQLVEKNIEGSVETVFPQHARTMARLKSTDVTIMYTTIVGLIAAELLSTDY